MKKGPQIRARAPSSSAPGGSEEKKKEPLKYKAMGNKRRPYERPDTTVVKVSEEHFLAGSFRGTLNPYGESTGAAAVRRAAALRLWREQRREQRQPLRRTARAAAAAAATSPATEKARAGKRNNYSNN
jgi:hypothetical protein